MKTILPSESLYLAFQHLQMCSKRKEVKHWLTCCEINSSRLSVRNEEWSWKFLAVVICLLMEKFDKTRRKSMKLHGKFRIFRNFLFQSRRTSYELNSKRELFNFHLNFVIELIYRSLWTSSQFASHRILSFRFPSPWASFQLLSRLLSALNAWLFSYL